MSPDKNRSGLFTQFGHRPTLTPPPLTVNPFGASRHTSHKGGGLRWRQPAVASSGPALVGGVAIEDGLTVPYMAVRVGGAMAVSIRSKNVIFHRGSASREDEAKRSFKICFHTFNKQLKIQRSIFHHRICCVQGHGRGGAYLSYDPAQFASSSKAQQRFGN